MLFWSPVRNGNLCRRDGVSYWPRLGEHLPRDIYQKPGRDDPPYPRGKPEENDDSDAPILRPAARRPLRSVAIIKLNSVISSSWAVTSLFLTIKRGWAEHAQMKERLLLKCLWLLSLMAANKLVTKATSKLGAKTIYKQHRNRSEPSSTSADHEGWSLTAANAEHHLLDDFDTHLLPCQSRDKLITIGS